MSLYKRRFFLRNAMKTSALLLFFFVLVVKSLHVSRSYDQNEPIFENFVTPLADEPALRGQNPFVNWLAGLVGVPALANINFNSPPTKRPNKPVAQKPVLKPPKNCKSCQCGVSEFNTRIYGGQGTNTEKYPWMVKLLYNNQFYCGASVINNKYLLTAAHCVQSFSPKSMTALVYKLNGLSAKMSISRSVAYDGFNINNFNSDVAVLELTNELDLNDTIPICLPSPLKPYTGYDATVTGWGKVEDGSLSSTLREVTVPIISNQKCRKTAYKPSRITDNMMCAGLTEGGKDACQGDSGGPLQVVENKKSYIVGITSWGEGCGKPNYPGVYTRVNRFLTWIRTNTKNACYCDK